MSIFDDIRRDREAGTPELGGWGWFGGRDTLHIATRNGGHRYVMGFRRKGLQSAQPTFQTNGVMSGAIDDLTEYVVGDGTARGQRQADADPSVYRMDVKSVDHPDARRIARVPELERIALAAEELAKECDRIAPVVGEAIEAHGLGNKHGIATANAFRAALTAFRDATR